MEGYIAQVLMFAGTFAPKNWAYCQGQIINISSNTALFSLIGTYYGGNGTTTFALPDFQGRAAIGAGQGPGLPPIEIGEMGGAEGSTMTVNQMAGHTHTPTATVPVSGQNGTTNEINNNIYATSPGDTYTNLSLANGSLGGVKGSDSSVGNSVPFGLRQPYLGMNFVICLYGSFPARP